MFYNSILWDADDDPDGNIQHIAEHGLDIADVEWVLGAPEIAGVSKSSGRPVVWGILRKAFISSLFTKRSTRPRFAS